MPSQRPSKGWTSYEDWDYGTMKERVESFMASLDKAALVDHVEAVLGVAGGHERAVLCRTVLVLLRVCLP